MKELFDGFEIIAPDKLSDYYKPGVWAMFGIPKEIVSEQYVCLNVGKNICIGEELQIDYKRLKEFSLFKSKRYVNQFNKMKFSYPQFASRLDYLYKEISDNYDSIISIIVTDVVDDTYIVEKYFAYTTEAEYWVSNGKYKPTTLVDSYKIKEIKEGIDISKISKELIKRIDNFGERYLKQRPVLRKED